MKPILSNLLGVALVLGTGAASASGAVTASCSTTPGAPSKSWVSLSVQTDARQYVTGAPIDVVLAAKNTYSRAAFLKFSSGQRFDLQLFRVGAKEPVYTWSATRLFAQSLDQLRLYPRQTQTFRAQIGDDQGALVPGNYELRAFLTNSSQIQAAPLRFEVVASPVQLRATLNTSQLVVGDPLAIKITATNTTQTAQTIRFGSGQSFDVSISNEDGQPIWTWGANKRFTQSLRSLVLAPGESKTFDAAWDGQPLPDFKIVPGTYSVQAILTSIPRVYAAPVRVEIK